MRVGIEPNPMGSTTMDPMEPANYDESRVPTYTLPDALLMADGTRVQRAEQWPQRRAELLALFARHQYGFTPVAEVSVSGSVLAVDGDFLDGVATLKQVEVVLEHRGKTLRLGVLLILPNGNTGGAQNTGAQRPVPAFLGLNFFGNHTVHADPRIRLHESWVANRAEFGIADNRACDASRGVRAHRWPVADIVASGYALVTAYAGDIDPDFADGFHNGAHGLFADADFAVPAAQRWGTIAAWSWGLSRILDYITASESAIDARRVIAIGHSRMGKAALWAAANDPRFAAVISNNSGCAGAALHRRRFGERVQHLNTNFPYWLNERAKAFSGREDDLPVDQHQLLALVAPRPVYVASAADDLWADPQGEFLSLKAAALVYRVFGIQDQLPDAFPEVPASFAGPLGYHLRAGGHDLLREDWLHFLDFTQAWIR